MPRCPRRSLPCSIETLTPTAEIAATTSGGDTDSLLPDNCEHAEVVRQLEASFEPMPSADEVFAGPDFEGALAKVPEGNFNVSTLRAMRERDGRAEEEGVALLVRLGETKWFAVRDGAKFNRNVVGEWAHVKWERKGGSTSFQCKVNKRLSLMG